jgi:kinesin family protein 1
MAEEESVQVAVRMRCFNGREKDAHAKRIIRMEQLQKGSKTYIANPDDGKEKMFEYDFSFQTFSEQEPEAGPYSSQETVFDILGRPVMESALEGRNVCLFAYGQTGAGKSYSMLGKPDAPGIIPRTCNAIFDKIAKENDPQYEHRVDIQVVEIYCEQINDLLDNRKNWPDHGHKPHLTNHGYVVDTVKKPCFKYADIDEAFKFADGNRSVGSHALNPESSRAHTIYTINYERKKRHETGKVIETVVAHLNLVDLAGSERTAVAGTQGQMLKEGNAINLSLTALGSCIKALSEGSRPNFRDSKLTLLLQGSMTNGRVIMIAALSPASICYEESMSTLRFADRIKKVKIKVSKNVMLDPVADIKKAMEEMRSAMQAEINSLKKQAAGTEDPESVVNLQSALKEQQAEAEQMRAAYEQRMKELSETNEDRAKRANDIRTAQEKALGGATLMDKDAIKDPHLRNLHEDSRLAETLIYLLKNGVTRVGRANKDSQENPPDLEFNGMGIIKEHAEIKWADGKVIITPGGNGRTLVNGKPIQGPTELKHNYRLWLGNNYAFRFVFPTKEYQGDHQFGDGSPDYAFAEQEIAQNASLEMANSPMASHLSKEMLVRLSESLKKVEQANIIAKDLGKNMEFEVKMFKNRLTNENDVAVMASSNRGQRVWPWEKFEQKLTEFSAEWERWMRNQSTGERYQRQKEQDDPFNDDEPQLIGEADIWLQSLANMMEFDCDAPVISVLSKTEGRMNVSLLPCDSEGGVGPWEDDDCMDPFVEEPTELLGQTIQFRIRIHDTIFNTKVEKSSACRLSHTWCRYKLNIGDADEPWSSTPVCKQNTFNPKFAFEKEHTLEITEQTLNFLRTGKIIIQIWGNMEDSPQVASNENVEEESDPALDAEIAAKRLILKELEEEVAGKMRLLAALL